MLFVVLQLFSFVNKLQYYEKNAKKSSKNKCIKKILIPNS